MFARAHSITTMETCKKARMEETLLRRDAAKMMVNFAINILGKKADRTRKCEFTDLAGLTTEEQNYIKTACELGLMGLNGDGTPAALFNPALPVDKVQFAVTLSRMLYGTTNNTTDACWYCKHIDALYDAKILTTKTALFAPFIRVWAMLMLQRVK